MNHPRFCQLCGARLPPKSGRGPRRKFCPPTPGRNRKGRVTDVHQCRDVHAALVTLARHGEVVLNKAVEHDYESFKAIKTDLFQLANCVPWNKNLKGSAEKRKRTGRGTFASEASAVGAATTRRRP